MDPITQQQALAAAGAGGEDPLYVEDVFQTHLYDGSGSTRDITNGINLAGKGGFVWTKCRNDSPYHELTYITGTTRYMWYTNTNDFANITDLTNPSSFSSGIDQYNSDGYRLKGGGANSNSTYNSRDYVSWTFRKAKGFLDIVEYNGTGTATTVAHNLGSVPGAIITFKINNSEDRLVYHRTIGSGGSVVLNSASTETTGRWNGAPTSTHFGLAADNSVNQSGHQYVALVFAHQENNFGENEDQNIINCGSFYTNSSGEATVNLGWEPQWVLWKASNQSDNWHIMDTSRGWALHQDKRLYANTSAAESFPNGVGYPTSTGFSFVDESSQIYGSRGYTFIAIRRPHKPPEAGTDVFKAHIEQNYNAVFNVGFQPDMLMAWRYQANSQDKYITARLMGSQRMLRTNNEYQEVSSSTEYWDWHAPTNKMAQNLWTSNSQSPWLYYLFKRAPGFMDVVTYKGTGNNVNRQISHSLTVAPQMIIVKPRNSGSYYWSTYFENNGPGKDLRLSSTSGSNSVDTWGNTYPTSSVFTVKGPASDNSGTQYVAFMFATLAGISKVGTYTGTGSAINVDCGFTTGARFVLIKRRSSTGGWYVWDATRGIVSGNEPFNELNNSNIETTNQNLIEPLSSGFTVNGSITPELNNSGGEAYDFLAIA